MGTESVAVKPTAVLLVVQVFGGVMSLLTLSRSASTDTIVGFATAREVALVVAGVNVAISVVVTSLHYRGSIWQTELSQTYARRWLIAWDTLLLALLTAVSGGPERSVFAPQFFAVPVLAAMAKEAEFHWRLTNFLLFVLGLSGGIAWASDGITIPEAERTTWFVIYTFIFALAPTWYALAEDAVRPTEPRGGAPATPNPPRVEDREAGVA